MGYQRPERGSAPGQDSDRELASCLPFLLDVELSSQQWSDHAAWNLRRVPELGGEFAPTELFVLAWRMRRILVTSEPTYLDDSRFPAMTCPGIIVVQSAWRGALDRLLVTVVGLLGPFARLYHGVKVEARDAHTLEVTAPAGPRRPRVSRRFVLDDPAASAPPASRTMSLPQWRAVAPRA